MSQIVTTLDALHELVDAYMAFDCFALDTETMAGREPYHAKDIPEVDTLTNIVFWVSLAGPGRSDAIPIGHPLGRELRAAVRVTSAQPDCPDPKTCARCSQGWTYNKDGSISRKKVTHNVPALFGPAPEQLTHEQVWPVLKPLLLGDARKIGHNIKFDAESVAKYLGEPMRGPFYDTQIAAQLINENHNAYNLGACSERDLHYAYDKSLGKAGVQNFSFEKAGRYARLDALAAWLLFKRQAPLLAKEKQHDLMYDVEAPIIEVVIDMELAGAPIDRPALERLEEDYRGKLTALQVEIEGYNGGPINLNAAAQIRELVYGKRGRKVLAVTQKTEEPATGIKALEKHAFKDPRLEDPFVPHNVKDKCVYAILDHARWHKVHSTYLANNLPAVRATGKLYGEFDQMGARTGRFSARSPNLQNIPVRQGKDIRALFIAGDGHKLIVNDYSQVELRILAHFTQDPLLLMAYHEGLDLHSATARTAYGIPEGEDPSTRQRSLAKNVNFSMVFGATSYTLVQKYEVPEDEAEALVTAFYRTYKKVAPWQAKVLSECRKRARSKRRHGYHQDPYVETILGRRRRLPDIILPDRREQVPGKDPGVTFSRLRARAERQAINTVIQGTAADIMKLAMVRLHRRIKDEGLPFQILMQVHDEVVVRAPEDRAEEAEAIIRDSMESVNMLTVPLVAEGTICDRWDEGK